MSIKEIKLAHEKWLKGPVAEYLRKSKERKDEFISNSRFPIKKIYTPLDLEEIKFDYNRDLGFPGMYPLTRGIDPLMYRGNFWVMAQIAGYGSGEDANERFKYLLEQGQSGFTIEFDLPTQVGYDSDHPLAQGEVGKVGAAIDSVLDAERLFEGIPFEKVRQIYTIINATSPIILAMFIHVFEKKGISTDQFRLTLQNDILKEYICRGLYVFPPEPSIRLSTDVMEYCILNYPNWNPLSICMVHIRTAGSTPVQEVAFGIANAIVYIERILERGLDIDLLAPKLSIIIGGYMGLFEEAAKFRATRRIWARLMKERFGAKDAKSMMARLSAFTGGYPLTAQQPANNIVRVTLEHLACVLGGAQLMGTTCYDEALAIPTEEAVQVAIRTQHVVAEESGITETVDPLAGSYFVETLTHQIEEAVLEYLQLIDEMGGAIKATEEGYFQRELAKAAYEYQKEVESGEKVVVGVNKYQVEEDARLRIFQVDPKVEKRQISRLNELKSVRDTKEVEKTLQKVRRDAEEEKNIMPSILDAVRSYATIGEISDVLRDVFGEHKEESNYM